MKKALGIDFSCCILYFGFVDGRVWMLTSGHSFPVGLFRFSLLKI